MRFESHVRATLSQEGPPEVAVQRAALAVRPQHHARRHRALLDLQRESVVQRAGDGADRDAVADGGTAGAGMLGQQGVEAEAGKAEGRAGQRMAERRAVHRGDERPPDRVGASLADGPEDAEPLEHRLDLDGQKLAAQLVVWVAQFFEEHHAVAAPRQLDGCAAPGQPSADDGRIIGHAGGPGSMVESVQRKAQCHRRR